MHITEIPRGFVTACRTLSIIPLPGRDAARFSNALPWFPAVGALLGCAVFGAAYLLLQVPSIIGEGGAAFVLVLLGAVLTRGLHLDGVADAADGLFSMTDKQRTLAVMKDSRIGTFGALALVAVLGAKWLAFARLLDDRRAMWIIPAFVVSRAAMVCLAASMSYARAENGTGAPFVKDATFAHGAAAVCVAVVLLFLMGPPYLLSLLPVTVSCWILYYIYQRRVGGITGDLLGAACEITETLTLAFATTTPENPLFTILPHTSFRP